MPSDARRKFTTFIIGRGRGYFIRARVPRRIIILTRHAAVAVARAADAYTANNTIIDVTEAPL